ncbi:lycopene cyclase family protein, partial [Flavobacteriaceae bacterium]|nr:lycopene cyclase family protein [Flavobacteriaceae bacterium]
FMDFDLPQKGNTRFIYVLPFSAHEALVEYTLFSADLLKDEEYEAAITDYLNQKNAGEFSIEDREQGSIPMTAYPFWKSNSPNVMHIGTAGGWTKASTGFTFQKSMRKTKEVINFLKTGQDLNNMEQRNRFWFYDLLFLDVLSKHNEKGHMLFSLMFKKNKPERIKIMRSFPVGLFIKALWKRIF